MRYHSFLKFILLGLLSSPTLLTAQDFTNLGGDLTTTLRGHNGLQVAAPNVVSAEKREMQLDGFIPFHRIHRAKTGLGPNFINRGCGSCHIQNGKGPVGLTTGPGRPNAMVIKVSLRGVASNGGPRDLPGIGEQLRDRNINGRRRFRTRLKWRKEAGRYPDGTRYSLQRPLLKYRAGRFRRRDVVSSLRMTPGIIGAGLLESIPEATVLGFSDPDDTDGDGISGRPQYVPNRKTGELALGRFGFRASHPTVEQQSAAAAFHDMGLTSDIFPSVYYYPEIKADTMRDLTIYQQLAGVPQARNQDNPQVIAGKEQFQAIGCDSCHKFNILTENDEHPELSGQTIHPFTDLLLHDMGPDLADERSEFSASGSEWRTTPLWGLGFLETVSDVEQHYLHDGRARTIEEAILWHGGEAETSREVFKNLTKSERAALVAFLRSL